MSAPPHAPPFPGGDSILPLKDKITAVIEGAAGAECPMTAFFDAWERLGLVNDYERFANELEEALKIELDRAMIRATVSSRVKSKSSIEKSILRRQEAQERSYTNLDEIFKGIHDLAGLRIIVDFPLGILAAQELVQRFQVVGKSEFSPDRDLGLDWKPRFGTFESTNYRVKICPTPDHALFIYREVLIEIQVLSLAESLYNKLAHPLVYKKTSGELSVKDQKLIDVSHGLSLCYWICLSCMQDQLEGQEMPEEVRKLGAIEEGAQSEQDMSELVQVTPPLPSSDGTISNSVLLDFIRDSQIQQARSSTDLFDKLVQVARYAGLFSLYMAKVY
jgi:ppGpp synthetase/RelA/SpoT-type nucleotidyltranferase